MKQIDNTTKKAYAQPEIKVAEIEPTTIMAGSGEEPQAEPKWYDGEIG